MIGEIVSNQYRLLEVASEDLVSTEYRAHDQREGRDVTLKLLHEQVCSRSTEGLYRYRRLIRDLEGLKHPSICPVYAHGEWNKRDYVVLAPPHGDALGKIDVREIDVSLAVHAILSAARGLEAAHRLGILHGSLNPESMLLHKNGDTAAELRNFGAGLLLDLTRVRGKDDVRRVFGYLAPEQSGILRKPTDGRSDIYSLGILFYQLLTGVPPYQSDDAHNLISEHISREPARPRERNPRIPDVLERIVLKLIAKDPDDRYQTLPGFIADLEQFEELARTGGSLDFEIGRNDRLRELNFATRMIGREAELGLLRKGVAAAKEGRGTLLFIRGEPGIGKTRLINELRVDVHQAGGLFVGGKCHQYESGTPFRALSGALEAYVERLRRLSPTQRSARVEELKNGVGDLGGEVLKLTPRLSELIGTPPPLPELEPEKERVRFLITAANFLAELGSRELPVVVFLEDLQWSDEGTIELLERLARKIEDKPLLVLASYRSNEVGPEHSLSRLKATLAADAVPFEDVEVKAFGLAETEQMIGRILLEKPERIRSLAQFLHARSRGNPFFIVELLRTVIDGGAVRYEDGRVEYDPARLEQVDLPENIVEAVLRRIEDVPAEDMQILSFAAVMGKHVDLGLLGQLSGRPLEEILGSVENGIRHQILTRDPVADGTVLFVHDRVREAFYRRVNDRDAALLHLKIAETLEAAPAADASVYDLAYHFSRAGVTDKALRYSLLAAQTAAQASANALAIELYEQSRKLLEAAGHPESKPEYALVLEQMGELRRILGQYDAALEALQACVPLLPPGDTLRLAQVLSRMADSHFEKGEPERTIELIERALRSLGVRLPRSKFGIYAGILRQLAIHFAHMTRPAWYNRRLPAFDATDEIKVRLTSRLFYVHIFFNPEYAFFLHLLNVNFCENLAPSKLLASQYAASGPVWLSLPWYWKTMRDLNLGLNLARQSGDRLNEARVLTHIGFTSKMLGRPAEGHELISRAIRMLKQLGEFFELGIAFAFRNHCNYTGINPIDEATAANEEFLSIARETKLLMPMGWALVDRGIFAALNGEFPDSVFDSVKEGIRLCELLKDLPDVVFSKSFLACLYSTRKEHEKAMACAREIRKLLPTHDLQSSWIQELFPICAKTFLDAVADQPELTAQQREQLMKEAKWFCSQALQRSKKFPVIAIWSQQVNGVYEWLSGRPDYARKAWQRAFEMLQDSPNPYRLAQLRLDSAKCILRDHPDDAQAIEYLLEARDLFERCHATGYLAQTQALLGRREGAGADVESRNALTFKRHLESLLSVTQVIGSVFDSKDLLERIVEYAMKVTGAGRGFVLLNSSAGEPLEMRVQRGLDPALGKQAFSYGTYGISLALIETVRQSREPLVASAQDSGEVAADLKSCGARQAMAVLLSTKDKDLGVLYLDNHHADGMFGEEELELMKSFGVQAAVAIENTRLVQSLVEQDRLKQELRLGRDIQSGFLPKEAPETQKLRVAAVMEPAREIGGDYYDYIRRKGPDGSPRVAVALGDVTGKGVGAGLHMALVKTALLTLSQEAIGLKDILIKANRILHGQMSVGTFITLLFLQWEPLEQELRFSGAGHGPFLVFRAQAGSVEEVATGGTALGLIPEVAGRIQENTLKLQTGDKVVLFTDGVTEAENRSEKQFGIEGLRASVARHGGLAPAAMIQAIRKDVAEFTGPGEPYDDMTLMILECVE